MKQRPGETKAVPDGETTRPSLLRRVRDYRDDPAWKDFFASYDPILRQWSRRLSLDPDTADELCQRTWMRLTQRMREFKYDPSGSFRGWLRRVFDSRVAELFAERNRNSLVSLDAMPNLDQSAPAREFGASNRTMDNIDVDCDGELSEARILLFQEAEAVQAAVRGRIDETTWEGFWLTAIRDKPVKDVAQSLGKSYAAVYYGSKRVEVMLRKEGAKRLRPA